ncbi:MAG TPA: hypothetical protein VH418_19605 [Solirubrobacteraceae bacterium]
MTAISGALFEAQVGKPAPAELRVERQARAVMRVGGQQHAVVGLAVEQLTEEPPADAMALRGGPDVQLDDLEVRRVDPRGAVVRAHGGRDAVGPPLPIAARVAVREAGRLAALRARRHEEVEVGPRGVPREVLVAPAAPADVVVVALLRQRVHLVDLVEARERVAGLDDHFHGAQASRGRGGASLAAGRSAAPRARWRVA